MLDSVLTISVILSTIVTITLLAIPKRYINHSPPMATTNRGATEPKISVQVLVLGDIGRSPRMQYHAMSIAKHGGRVDLIGYYGMCPADSCSRLHLLMIRRRFRIAHRSNGQPSHLDCIFTSTASLFTQRFVAIHICWAS
jgi:hypothetical protein